MNQIRRSALASLRLTRHADFFRGSCFMTCNVDQLYRYHDGELDAGAAREVEAHVTSCHACRALLGDLQSMSGWSASAQVPVVHTARLNAIAQSAWHASSDRGVRRLAGWITAAAAAVMAFALLDLPSEQSSGTFSDNSQTSLIGSIP